MISMLSTFTIDDDLSSQESRGIEVILQLENGTRRWCYFMTPGALAACGDWIDGTQIRIHYAAPYMIVVACQLTEDVIENALKHIDRAGEIEKCTLAID
ncbi:MAG: hypothetical protein PHP85_13510 [Gallionella sp.]|nr:hypothetical protein [Gallionella sp.]